MNNLEMQLAADWGNTPSKDPAIEIEEREHLIRGGTFHTTQAPDWIKLWAPIHQEGQTDTSLSIYVTALGLTIGYLSISKESSESPPASTATETIELPFDPGEFGKDDVESFLLNIEDYEEEVQEEIYRHTKKYYLEESTELKPSDIINIRQTQLFAEENNYEEWIDSLGEMMESYFEAYEDSPVFSSRTESGFDDAITPNRARELLQERERRLREAMGDDFGDHVDDVIEEMQTSYINLIISDIRNR